MAAERGAGERRNKGWKKPFGAECNDDGEEGEKMKRRTNYAKKSKIVGNFTKT